MPPWIDDALQVDTGYCSQMLGAPQSGTPSPKVYKNCKLARGRRYGHTGRDAARGRMYPDSEIQDRSQGFCHRRHDRIGRLEFLRQVRAARATPAGWKAPDAGAPNPGL
jgi:hypothetical protein